MFLGTRIKEIIAQQGLDYKENPRTIYTTCPACGRDDKMSILKENGWTICYRGSCSFGKRRFEEWLAMTANISRAEASDRIYKRYEVEGSDLTDLKLNLSDEAPPETQAVKLDAIEWPLSHGHNIESPESAEGTNYLAGRGVSAAIAQEYGIIYSSLTRRVVMPIKMNGICYGWQGRAIDPVDPSLRMRNNPGLNRASVVMFYDRLLTSKHAILAEGPFDAIKFHLAGGNVCTMGKAVSQRQIDLLIESGVQRIYLALDKDAAAEMRQLQKRIGLPLFLCEVPQSCIDRCNAKGKKADFGECTMEECLEAFKSAKSFDQTTLVLHLKD